jgi:hypothetical protein
LYSSLGESLHGTDCDFTHCALRGDNLSSRDEKDQKFRKGETPRGHFLGRLDVIIDPVALRGSRWFLGQIYGYPQPGVYFGVPISNFAGWFAMGFVLIWALQAIDRFMEMKRLKDW